MEKSTQRSSGYHVSRNCCCSVAQSCLMPCDTMDCSILGSSVLHLPKLTQTHVHWVSDAIQPSCPLLFLPSIFPSSRVNFLMSWLFTSGGQSIGALSSGLPMNIQDWFPLELTGLISLQSNFSNTTVQKHKFYSTQPSLWSNSHIHTQLLEKP